MSSATDTITAISTPPGRGGIGIVRLSGPEAASIAAQLVELHQPLEPGRARLASVLDQDSVQIDEAVVTFFAAPHSYTTEDVVEIAAHGSPVVLDFLLRRLEVLPEARGYVAQLRLRPLANPMRMNGCAMIVLGADETAGAARRLLEPHAMGHLFKALALCHPALPALPGFAE